jgi:hypothetical protein
VGAADTPTGAIEIAAEFDRFISSVAAAGVPQRRPPRVFVSHQRSDAVKAERIAWHATEVGFEYWLDIHNPALRFANVTTAPPPIKAVVIAAIIEIGLLNSSHVVAVQTSASQRSRWVPYEFGRAKQRLPVSGRAASWFESGTGPDPNGDYLSLAFCAATESQLEGWFVAQRGSAPSGQNILWKGGVPPPLPN